MGGATTETVARQPYNQEVNQEVSKCRWIEEDGIVETGVWVSGGVRGQVGLMGALQQQVEVGQQGVDVGEGSSPKVKGGKLRQDFLRREREREAGFDPSPVPDPTDITASSSLLVLRYANRALTADTYSPQLMMKMADRRDP